MNSLERFGKTVDGRYLLNSLQTKVAILKGYRIGKIKAKKLKT